LLTEHGEEVRQVVSVLLERETLSGDEIRAVMRGEELPPTRVEPQPAEQEVKPAEEEAKPSVGGEQPQVA